MKFSAILVATATIAALAGVVPASAEPDVNAGDGVCPVVGLSTGCNILISFNLNGTISTGPGSSTGSYDGAGATLIGVINNTANPISSFNVSSNGDIFGFTTSGIDGFAGDGVTATGDNPDETGYGGPDVYFTAITGSASNEPEAGTVNFGNGGLAAFGIDYFALVDGAVFNAAPTLNPYEPDPLLPEPATFAILGVGVLASGMARRFRRKG